MIERLPALARGLHQNAHLLAHPLLTDHFVQALGPERIVDATVLSLSFPGDLTPALRAFAPGVVPCHTAFIDHAQIQSELQERLC